MARKPKKKLADLIPSSIRIKRDVTYQVLFTDNFPNDKDHLGECNPHTKQIILNKNQSDTELFKCFLHEICHGISFESDKLNLTERQVLELEEGLFRVLRLNKYV